MNMNNTRRTYDMSTRARASAETAERIVDAYVQLFWEQVSDQITLDEVAARAGVTVQTILRKFGSKERLFAAAVERESTRIGKQRSQAPPGDPDTAVSVLLDHYEEMGDAVLRLLAEEGRNPAVDQVINLARASHRQWCEHVFHQTLSNIDGEARSVRLAQFVAICDVYTWKLLRRDAGLTRAQTELALLELLKPLVNQEVP